MQYQPHAYQLDAIKHICANPGAGLFLDPGMGKTSSTLAAFTVLRDSGVVHAALVVAPLRPVHKVWPAEVAKWDDFNGLRVSVLHGPNKAALLRMPADLYVINYEGLKWLETQLGPKLPFDMLIIDESTKIKSPKAIRTKILDALKGRVQRVVILTGTPAPKNVQDLFTQIRMLDGGERLGKFITHFRRKYFDEFPQYGGYSEWVLRDGAREAIEDRIADICMTLQSTDHLAMPEMRENTINVDVPDDVWAAYRELESQFITQLNDGTVTAANAAVAAGKLRQIVGGGVYAGEGQSDVIEFETNKLDALVDLVEEQSGQPLLVAVGFLHEVERIRKALGDETIPYLGGGVTTKRSNEIIDRWNAGEYPVLLAHPTSVAHGLNLQAGGHAVCWYTLTWNLEEFIQFNGRVWRQGQQSPFVVIHYLVAEGTIDEHVLDVLRSKAKNQNALIDGLKRKYLPKEHLHARAKPKTKARRKAAP